MVNNLPEEGRKPSDQSPLCLPVHRIHKFDLVVEQGCFAGDHGSPETHSLANIAVMLSKRAGEGGYQKPRHVKAACLPQLSIQSKVRKRFRGSAVAPSSQPVSVLPVPLLIDGRMAQAS